MRYLFIQLLLMSMLSAAGQETPINGPDVTQCGGFLVDDGLSANPYGANQNQTITLCAVQPETILNLYFTIFDLGSGDVITIYDGNSTAAPLIGTFMGTSLQSTDVTSTNASGCLTVQFTSDATGTGNFAAEISCGLPCIRPVSAIETGQGPIPILVCPGEPITFDGSGSTFAPGASIQSLQWIFDDGTTNTTAWPQVTHTYDEPGGYKVQLMLTDNNNCSNTNLTDYVVLVSTYPNFSLVTTDMTVCNGTGVVLGANFNSTPVYEADSLNQWVSNPWIDLPDINLGGSVAIPDDQTQCFDNSVTFTNFSYNDEIQSVNDLAAVSVNMEHSFLGDLVMSLICPNGQSVVLHQQGGGGTGLGIPDELDNGVPGIGWDYSWSPSATLGTMATEAGNTLGGSLPEGTYQSAQPWTSLIGCPLNGTWTLEICDMWSIDDGYIFDWSIEFNSQFYGDLLSFTPIYGIDCDSSYWSGPFIGSTSNNCDFVTLNITTPGTYDYNYTLVNNFGCSFDTTITVELEALPPLTAGPDFNYSCLPVSFQGGLIGAPNTGYVFYWSPYPGLSNPGSPVTPINWMNETTTYTLHAHPNGHPECLQTDDVTVTLIEYMEAEVQELYQACDGDLITVEAPVISGGTPPFSVSWLMDNAFQFNTQSVPVIVNSLHEYCAIVEDLCGLTDTACSVVTAYPIIPATFQIDDIFGCEPHRVLMTSDYTAYQNIAQMKWHFEDGDTSTTLGSVNHEYGQSGYYLPWLEITDLYGCVYTDTASNEIAVWPTPIADFYTDPNVVILPSTTFEFKNTTVDGSIYEWTFDVFGESELVNPEFSFPPNRRGSYMVQLYATNQYGCEDSTTRQVIVKDRIQIFAPNTFTPNYDGINDVWQIQGTGFRKEGYYLEIFNRWGDVVFATDDPEMAWTGNSDNAGHFVPDGIYLFRLRVRDIEYDVNYKYEGHINIIR